MYVITCIVVATILKTASEDYAHYTVVGNMHKCPKLWKQ